MPKAVKPTATPVQEGPMTAKLFGEFVRAKRTQEGIKIHDAALLCDVSVETLSKIETAKAQVQFRNILKVADKLGIELRVVPWLDNE